MRIIGKSGAYYVANPFGADKAYAFAKYRNRMAFLERKELPDYVPKEEMDRDYHEIDTEFYGKKLTVEVVSLGRKKDVYVDRDGWMHEPIKSNSRVYYVWEDYEKALREAYGELKIETDGELRFYRILRTDSGN